MNIPITSSLAAESRVVLGDISWQQYQIIGEVLRDRPCLRLTYYRGRLEIMTTSSEHERIKRILGRLVETLAEEFEINIAPFGNMTFQQELLDQGFEPDDCFWIAHEREVRAMREWLPDRDPPPDLTLEIEISRSAIPRMRLFGQLGVPEVWRCDGERLRVHLRQTDGTYQESEMSPTFPEIPISEVVQFLHWNEDIPYLQMVRQFREWVRQQRSASE